jgi:catechol 2,3-dioxygenase-like lactoylglutathione lyase family enzyme
MTTKRLSLASRLDRLIAVEEEVIPVFYVENAARAVTWYVRLGFRKEWEHQFEPGFPLFVSVARGRIRLYLSEHKGDARPNTLIHLNVKDIDTVSDEFGIPVDEEGLAGRECDLEDPDGNRLRVATPRS